MKRKDGSKKDHKSAATRFLHLGATFFLFGQLCSCSMFTNRVPVTEQGHSGNSPSPSSAGHNEDGQESSGVIGETVPKEQYDQLLAKYEALVGRMRREEAGPAETQQVAETVSLAPAEPAPPSEAQVAVEETKENLPAGNARPMPETERPAPFIAYNDLAPGERSLSEEQIKVLKEEVKRYESAKVAHEKQNYLEALKGMQSLEKSTSNQVQVRAKFYVGDILMNQGEFDLASQVFEEIVKNYGFSSYVLKSLKNLVNCSNKLNQADKVARYTSMLRDIFGEEI